MEPGFDDFIDDIVVMIADLQSGPVMQRVDISKLHADYFSDRPDTWALLAPQELEQRGYGRDARTMAKGYFLINGAGISHAAKVRKQRQPLTWMDRARAVPRSDWIALGALVVATIALFN